MTEIYEWFAWVGSVWISNSCLTLSLSFLHFSSHKTGAKMDERVDLWIEIKIPTGKASSIIVVLICLVFVETQVAEWQWQSTLLTICPLLNHNTHAAEAVNKLRN